MTSTSDQDVFDVLDSDHRALLELAAAGVGSDVDGPTPAQCDQLTMAVVRHLVAEEQYLLPLVRDRLDEGDGLSAAELDEHRSIENKLRTLENVEHSQVHARRLLLDVAELLGQHVTRQQDELFPALRLRCDEVERRQLASEVIGVEQIAPTRARIVHPESPSVNKVVSLVTGFVDRTRDAYTHRGTDVV